MSLMLFSWLIVKLEHISYLFTGVYLVDFENAFEKSSLIDVAETSSLMDGIQKIWVLALIFS